MFLPRKKCLFGPPLRLPHTTQQLPGLFLLWHQQPPHWILFSDTHFLSKPGRAFLVGTGCHFFKRYCHLSPQKSLWSISSGRQHLSPAQAPEAISSTGPCRPFCGWGSAHPLSGHGQLLAGPGTPLLSSALATISSVKCRHSSPQVEPTPCLCGARHFPTAPLGISRVLALPLTLRYLAAPAGCTVCLCQWAVQLAQQKAGTHSVSLSFCCPDRLQDGSRDPRVSSSLCCPQRLQDGGRSTHEAKSQWPIPTWGEQRPGLEGPKEQMRQEVCRWGRRCADGQRPGHPEPAVCKVCLWGLTLWSRSGPQWHCWGVENEFTDWFESAPIPALYTTTTSHSRWNPRSHGDWVVTGCEWETVTQQYLTWRDAAMLKSCSSVRGLELVLCTVLLWAARWNGTGAAASLHIWCLGCIFLRTARGMAKDKAEGVQKPASPVSLFLFWFLLRHQPCICLSWFITSS